MSYGEGDNGAGDNGVGRMVVIGDLGLYKGDSVLWLQNYGDQLEQNTTPSGDFECTLDFERVDNQLYQRFVQHQVATRGWLFALDENGILFRNQNSAGSQTIHVPIDFGAYTVVFGMRQRDGETLPNAKTMYLSLDGGTEITKNAGISPTIISDLFLIGYGVNARMGRFKMSGYHNFDYKPSMDSFGGSILTDYSGYGNHLTIAHRNSWWKQGVDEVYANPSLYQASWIIPMEEAQQVIYTDGTPFYPTDDPFWNPYNQDPVHSFTVTKQKYGSGVQKWIRRGLRRVR